MAPKAVAEISDLNPFLTVRLLQYDELNARTLTRT